MSELRRAPLLRLSAPDGFSPIDDIIDGGLSEDPRSALAEIVDVSSKSFVRHDPFAQLQVAYAQAMLLPLTRAETDECLAAAAALESLAHELEEEVWVALARTLRAQVYVEAGDTAAAMTDVALIDLTACTQYFASRIGFRLFDTTARTYAQLRLFDRMEVLREQLEASITTRPQLDQLTHWLHWSVDVAVRCLEPVARGASEPDPRVLDHALQLAQRIIDSQPPRQIHLAATTVLALGAAYRGQPSQALGMLEAITAPQVDPLVAQLHTLATLHAHLLVGSPTVVRALDEGTRRSHVTFSQLILDIAQARERLWLEHTSHGNPEAVLTRLSDLLTRLSWHSMNLAAHTAQPALELQSLRAESRTDALTGIGNRRALDEELQTMLRHGPLPVALIVVDVDKFKSINDMYSHALGDEVLRRIAAALRQQLRPGDRLVRYGGDEFVVLATNTSQEQAKSVGAQLELAVAVMAWHELATGLQVHVTTGYAALWTLTGRRPAKDAEVLFRQADEILLHNKRMKRSQSTDSTAVLT